ncbi:hypothetical protein CDAR_172531 [Caerostris darwini]|uniref:Uncharacterized protein n=1 Tax=Caerostris darwini TaxID=1538125 RepID=A0AAV4MEC4_9ARAC|nr:hypothetical protein CDAR_172531 [Caerostris darwini]
MSNSPNGRHYIIEFRADREWFGFRDCVFNANAHPLVNGMHMGIGYSDCTVGSQRGILPHRVSIALTLLNRKYGEENIIPILWADQRWAFEQEDPGSKSDKRE